MRLEAGGAPAPDTTKRLVRAALMGLSGGLVLGGLALLALGLFTRLGQVDCTDMSEVECGFTREAAADMGQVQALMGAGLLALGLAGVVFLRRPAAVPPPA